MSGRECARNGVSDQESRDQSPSHEGGEAQTGARASAHTIRQHAHTEGDSEEVGRELRRENGKIVQNCKIYYSCSKW